MFYEKQSEKQKNKYKEMLNIVGSLSNLFSESDTPYLYYRCHENIFCKYFEVQNLSREDCSADAQKENIGIGLKTWIGTDNQKIAEFNKLKHTYMDLKKYDMICKIAEYRNERIRVTKKIHGMDDMIYHIVKREPKLMKIYECEFDLINIKRIKIDKKKGNKNNIYFSDGKHEYHFNISKSTLYMIFDYMELLDSFEVSILENPYSYLEEHFSKENIFPILVKEKSKIFDNKYPQLCLRLYTINKKTKENVVNEHSGLNLWNAKGRKRNENEIYIPYPVEDKKRNEEFFPPRGEKFEIILPDGQIIEAKVCQSGGKAIMSNPNYKLGKWLLRNVFELPVGKMVTYDMLKIYGIDSVIFTKIDQRKYKIEFTDIGTYERFIDRESEGE